MRNIFVWLFLGLSLVSAKGRISSPQPSLLSTSDDTIFWNHYYQNAQCRLNHAPDSALMLAKIGLSLAIRKKNDYYIQLFQEIIFSANYKAQDSNFDKAFYVGRLHSLREQKLTEMAQSSKLAKAIQSHQEIRMSTLISLLITTSLLFLAVLGFMHKRYKEKERIFQKELEELSALNSHSARAPVATILGLVSIYNRKNIGDKFNVEVVRMVEDEAQKLDDILHEIARRTYK